jgi:ferric-dicitrate binding protein FerR (iron transport regulator)
MKNRVSVQVVAIVLCGLLASPALSPLSAASPAALGRVVVNAPATMNGIAVPREATMYSGDRLATGAKGWARVYLSPAEQIYLDSTTEARAARNADGIGIELVRGGAHLQTGSGVRVLAGGLEVVPQSENAVWQVKQTGANEVLVVALKGSVEVRGSNRTVEVPAGRSARVTTSPAPPANPGGGSYGLSTGAKRLSRRLPSADHRRRGHHLQPDRERQRRQPQRL